MCNYPTKQLNREGVRDIQSPRDVKAGLTESCNKVDMMVERQKKKNSLRTVEQVYELLYVFLMLGLGRFSFKYI